MYDCPLCGTLYSTEIEAYNCCIGKDDPEDYEQVIGDVEWKIYETHDDEDDWEEDNEEWEEDEEWD